MIKNSAKFIYLPKFFLFKIDTTTIFSRGKPGMSDIIIADITPIGFPFSEKTKDPEQPLQAKAFAIHKSHFLFLTHGLLTITGGKPFGEHK